jgi:pyrrolidone-carboxylate peptidase
VRNFDPATLDPELGRLARIEVHVLTDVPVLYVEGARRICDEIARVDADVAISFGVGSDGNVDADVETECANAMDDCSEPFGQDRGPFRLPAAWPPAGSQSSWSDEDQAWLWRYPDNAGVSYNGEPIDPAGPDRLISSLPVAKIVARVQAAGLSAHDGAGGPGRYICNNVMYRVVQTQQARGRLGGFVHLAQWQEAKKQAYLQVVRCAIEESVRATLARDP